MTTVATTNPQDAKMVGASENLQDAKLVLSKFAGCPPEEHPELNGYLLKSDTADPMDPIYLIIDGKRCHVPDMGTFKNLFRDGVQATPTPFINVVTLGTALESGAIVIKADGDPPHYLLTNGKKRKITNPEIFALYRFDSAKVKSFPAIVIRSIPDGTNVPGRP